MLVKTNSAMAKFLPYSEETAAQSIRMAIADSLSQMSVAMTNGWIEIQSPSDWRAYNFLVHSCA